MNVFTTICQNKLHIFVVVDRFTCNNIASTSSVRFCIRVVVSNRSTFTNMLIIQNVPHKWFNKSI